MRVAEYLREKLPLELSKTFKHKPTRLTTSAQAHSPLYNTLLKICSGYKAISAYSESIFAYTETTAVLLDVKAQSLTRVHFGKQAVAALVLDSQGQPCQPTSSQQHYMDNTFVHEETFSSVAGRHSVVLGSPGLWYAATLLLQLKSMFYTLHCSLIEHSMSMSAVSSTCSPRILHSPTIWHLFHTC